MAWGNGEVGVSESKAYLDVVTQCVDCREIIIEIIPKDKVLGHKERVRCCKCLSKWFARKANGGHRA